MIQSSTRQPEWVRPTLCAALGLTLVILVFVSVAIAVAALFALVAGSRWHTALTCPDGTCRLTWPILITAVELLFVVWLFSVANLSLLDAIRDV
ncbi:MAG: hypothetical protein WEB00_03230 [Dehalococcoidia bacterium]